MAADAEELEPGGNAGEFGCGTAGLAEGVAVPRPYLRTLQQLTNVPKSSDPRVCPPLTFPPVRPEH